MSYKAVKEVVISDSIAPLRGYKIEDTVLLRDAYQICEEKLKEYRCWNIFLFEYRNLSTLALLLALGKKYQKFLIINSTPLLNRGFWDYLLKTYR